MYSSPKLYDPLIAPNEVLNYRITKNAELSSHLLYFLAEIERGVSKTWNNSQYRNAKLYVTDEGLVVERLSGGAKPFGSIRYNFYIRKDGGKLTEKPKDGDNNSYKFTLIVNCRGVDLSTQYEWYFPENLDWWETYGVIRDKLIGRYMQVKNMPHVLINMGNGVQARLRKAMSLCIGISEGKRRSTLDVTLPEGGFMRIDFEWQIRFGMINWLVFFKKNGSTNGMKSMEVVTYDMQYSALIGTALQSDIDDILGWLELIPRDALTTEPIDFPEE